METKALPPSPSIDFYRRDAKSLLRAAKSGEPEAVQRLEGCPRVRQLVESGAVATYLLADAQHVIAREHGFESWPKFVGHLQSNSPRGARRKQARLIRPPELAGARSATLPDGTTTTTDVVWSMFDACAKGDLPSVTELVARHPSLVRYEYNYTPPVHFAVREGHPQLVRFLLDHGTDVTYRTYPFQDSLFTIARDRGHEEVAEILEAELAQRFPLTEGLHHFLTAARAGDVEAVRAHLERDPELARASNDTGDTALHQAAFMGHVEVMAALLDAGAGVDAVRADGYRPIHCALLNPRRAYERSVELARFLLDRGARYNIFVAAALGDTKHVDEALATDPSLANFEDTCHHRPLSAAARRHDLTMVEKLLAHGADPNLPEEGAPRGQALWFAAYRDQPAMARALLEHGADPRAEVESSGTPLGHARNHPEIRQLFVEFGTPEAADEPDPFDKLVNQNEVDAVEAYLRDHPVRVGAAELSDRLGDIANRGQLAMVELFLRHGARVPDVSKWGRFYYFKHDEIISVLLDAGANPNHMNWNHVTVLHQFAHEGELAKAQRMIDHGADIEAVDDEYCSTPLGFASRAGRQEMVALLLEAGANPNGAGAPWATPLAWARRKGYPEIEADLLRAGAADGDEAPTSPD